MLNESILEKYRPKSMDDFILSSKTRNRMKFALENIKNGSIRALLFTGSKGSGKTSFARFIGKTYGTLDSFDCLEADNATDRGIDYARKMGSYISSRPLVSKTRILILDEAHMLTVQAQNTFLKTLEDLPPGNVVILCSTEPSQIIGTIIDRCFTIDFNPDSTSPEFLDDIYTKYLSICKEEKVKPKVDEFKKAIKEILIPSFEVNNNISIRSLIMFLYEFATTGTLPEVEWLYTTGKDSVDPIAIAKFIVRNKVKEDSWQKMARFIYDLKTDPETVRILVSKYLLTVYVNSIPIEKAVKDEKKHEEENYSVFLLHAIQVLDTYGQMSGPMGKSKLLLAMREIYFEMVNK